MAYNAPTPGEISDSMVKGLIDLIRSRLKQRILESIDADLEASIDSAMDHFKLTVASYQSTLFVARRNPGKNCCEHYSTSCCR